MKKNFPLTAKDKSAEQVLEAAKNEVRQCINRENRKKLPADMNYWRFHCEFGKTKDTTKEIAFPDIFKMIDQAAAEGAPSFYLILLTTAIKLSGKEEKENKKKEDKVTKKINQKKYKKSNKKGYKKSLSDSKKENPKKEMKDKKEE